MRIAPGAKLVVKATWLHSVVASVRQPRKKSDKRKYDIKTAVAKRLIDGFYTPSKGDPRTLIILCIME